MSLLLPLTFTQAQTLGNILEGGIQSIESVLKRGGVQDLMAMASFMGKNIDPDKMPSDEELTEIVQMQINDLKEIREIIKESYGI